MARRRFAPPTCPCGGRITLTVSIHVPQGIGDGTLLAPPKVTQEQAMKGGRWKGCEKCHDIFVVVKPQPKAPIEGVPPT